MGNGKSFDIVAQAWDAAMADAKAEDTVLAWFFPHGRTCHGSD
ncbi:hypothetical protein ACLB1Q_32365 [Escherichia coli]